MDQIEWISQWDLVFICHIVDEHCEVYDLIATFDTFRDFNWIECKGLSIWLTQENFAEIWLEIKPTYSYAHISQVIRTQFLSEEFLKFG